MSNRIYYLVLGFAFLLIATVCGAQQYLELGSHSYSRAPAPALTKTVSRGAAFFRAVGGVAFEGVAEGREGIKVTGLEYVPSRKDGDRLRVTVQNVDGSTSIIRAKIYDWQLVPIARFAESQFGAAMTLFGSLEDKDYEQRVLKQNGRAINYHPAFDNTLMGLRLMQADIMLFDENAVDLPRNSQGYILGSGETAPNVQENKQRFAAISRFLVVEAKNGHSYISYVTGDLDQKVTFYVKEQTLAFTGTPRWTMWDYSRTVRSAIDDLRNLESENYDALLEKYGSAENVKKALEANIPVLKQMQNGDAPPQIDPDLSRRVSKRVSDLAGINPTVYEALRVTMRYGALFRHYKQHSPKEYSSFVRSLANVQLIPVVVTPTVQQTTPP